MGVKITLAGHGFEGPYDSARLMYEKAGVFVILCKDIREQGKFYVIDVDEAAGVRSAAQSHKRQVDWVKNCRGTGTIAVAVIYMENSTKEQRVKITSDIRSLYDVPCG